MHVIRCVAKKSRIPISENRLLCSVKKFTEPKFGGEKKKYTRGKQIKAK